MTVARCRGHSIRRLSIVAGLLTIWTAAAADEPLLSEVRQVFGHDLPRIETLIPGYARPDSPQETLAVGNFLPAEDSLLMHSFAVGEVLRWHIQFTPTVKLTMPSAYSTATDAAVRREPYDPVLATPAHFSGLHTTLGIKNGLTGTMRRDGEHIVIEARLIDTVSGETLSSRSWRSSEQALPDSLIGISTWVYDELGVTLSDAERAYIGDADTLRPEALSAFVENIEALGVEDLPTRQALLARLRTDHPRFPLLAAYELYARTYPNTPREVNEQLDNAKRTRLAFPQHGGVGLDSYRTIAVEKLDERQAAKHLQGLRQLVAANANDPMMLINLATVYGEQGDYFKAIAVNLEAAERWPAYYRTWWVLGNLVNERSWEVRGEGYMSEVSPADRRRFRQLAALGDRLTERALMMHGRNANLWQSKINGIGTRGGYSPRLMSAFERAVEVAPSHRMIYANALNYAQNKWGGNASARRRIITLAEENNPDAAWPKMMRSEYASDFEGLSGISDEIMEDLDVRRLLENRATWQILFVLILGLIVLSSSISARRARRAAAAGTTTYPADSNEASRKPRDLTPDEQLDRLRRRG